jgi:tetratricopeptide (TPR) repeat protein
LTSANRPALTTSRRLRDPFARLEQRTFLLAFLLILITLAVYNPVKRLPFVNYDDRDYVTRNLQVQSGLEWDTVQWAFTTLDAANWHPLTWLSHALDYQLFGLNPARHHSTNLLLHAVNVALLFWVLRRATGYAGRSFMVAALFALHPINVESVAWVSERKNLLSMLFFLLALGAWRWYAQKPRLDRYVVVAVLFTLGLMAKPQIITLPFVLLLWDYWPLQRMFPPDSSHPEQVLVAPRESRASLFIPGKSFSWLLLEKLPLLALSTASAIITVIAQRAGGAMSGLSYFPRSIRLENAIVSYVRYLDKTLWPARLANFYPHPQSLLNPWQVLAALALLLAITALVIAQRRHRYLIVGWLWFLGTMVPMVGIVHVGVQAMADRYAYLPFIGLFLMIGWAVSDWADQRRVTSAWLPVASIFVLLALAAITHRQIGYWSDSYTLWDHATQVTSSNWMAEDNLGGLLLEQHDVDAAMPHFYRAAAINPGDPTSNLNVGAYEQQRGNPQKAIEYYQRVLHSPQSPPNVKAMAVSNLEKAYAELGITAPAQPQ